MYAIWILNTCLQTNQRDAFGNCTTNVEPGNVVFLIHQNWVCVY
jgi:hypothetical protein